MQSSFLRTCSDTELEEVIEKIKEMQSEAAYWRKEAAIWKEETQLIRREIDLLKREAAYYKLQMEIARNYSIPAMANRCKTCPS